MSEQRVSARPRDRKVLTSEELAKQTFANLQNNDPNSVPIVEVLSILSTNKEPGHITYRTLIKKSQAGTLLQFDSKNRPDGSLQNLSSAYAEAIVLKTLRNNTGSEASAIFEPVTQARNAIEPYSSSSNSLFRIPAEASNAILKSFANKTPDILFTVPKIETRIGNTTEVTYGSWGKIVNPKDPTNTKKLLEYEFRNQSLLSPVEVTISGDSTEINKKIKKFEEDYKNPFPRDKTIAYVPVLVMDYDNYKNISNFEKPKIINRMRQLGGFVSLVPNLQRDADRKAIEAAIQLTSIMQSRRKEIDKQEVDNSLMNQGLYLDGNSKSETNSLFSKAWQGAKTNFTKLSEKFKSSLNNKSQEITSIAPLKKRLASDIYQEKTSSIKETVSYPEKVGINVIGNSNHLDLMLSKQLATTDWEVEKILKQSPNYRSKEPNEANLWLKNMINDGKSMSKEYYLDSTGSQKIIRSYDNDVSRPPEKSNFEKLSESVQRYNSEYTRNREGLLVAVATAAIRDGMNPEQVLRESPDYLSAMSGKGESLVEKTIEKAESAIQVEKSRVEQQAQRDSQRGSDHGYER
jgi:hypothetical protein